MPEPAIVSSRRQAPVTKRAARAAQEQGNASEGYIDGAKLKKKEQELKRVVRESQLGAATT